ncbi:kinesin-like protein KIF25 [Scleropages formosus]|uniref:kinesin-like protein KIF25 n=1 Tax=Scleropages formosus TaxID=113540 RepID=UPI0010FA943B|nr:kinesin-like protein KIF25 [Scleropages formosus]
MPLFINRDQIFAHQVHLLEHKLRTKEERILELETENALLHLRLAECLGKLRKAQEEEADAHRCPGHGSHVQKRTQAALRKILTEVQVLKQGLRDVFAVYLGFSTELGLQSKELLDKVAEANSAVQEHDSHMHSLRSHVEMLEKSLQEEKEHCKEERLRRKVLHNTLVELRGNIRVHCRVRPILPFDGGLSCPAYVFGSALSEQVIRAISDDTILVNSSKAGSSTVNKMFDFDRVHGPEDTQDAVFEEVRPLLTSLLDGYNVCIVAYGQTGSGKTHTMIGSLAEEPVNPEDAPLQGIIPKAAAELFRLISEKPAESHVVEVSVVEVYNNEVFDLLSRDSEGAAVGTKRDVITTSTGTSEVTSLTYEMVQSPAEVMQHISSVLHLRARSSTLIHRDSSRSHLIVTLTVTSKSPSAVALARRLQSVQQELQRGSQKEWWSPRCRRATVSRAASPACSPYHSPSHSPCPSPRPSITQAPMRTKLQLVDLAGSECVGVSGVTGPALWETSCINRSLSALSDVLGALAEQRPHVPFRNSKLTHLLQDSIGGDAKLLVMLCVSPSQRFLTETLQTLGFGARARQVHRPPPRRKNAALKLK